MQVCLEGPSARGRFKGLRITAAPFHALVTHSMQRCMANCHSASACSACAMDPGPQTPRPAPREGQRHGGAGHGASLGRDVDLSWCFVVFPWSVQRIGNGSGLPCSCFMLPHFLSQAFPAVPPACSYPIMSWEHSLQTDLECLSEHFHVGQGFAHRGESW